MKIKLHWQIMIGMIAGAVFGFIANEAGFGSFVVSWIKPIGTIFIRLISMIAVPLVLASLVVGTSSMKDLKKLSRIGTKTIVIYVLTTVLAISIGLFFADVFKPGVGLDQEVTDQLRKDYSGTAGQQIAQSDINLTEQVIGMVPQNPFYSLSTPRGEMIQVVFFALFLGVVLTMISPAKSAPVVNFFDGLNDALIRIIEVVMRLAPYGVFALVAAVIADFGFGILKPLGKYSFVVVLGLFIHLTVVYSIMLKLFSKVPLKRFWNGITEAQLVAFSSSSSAAALPVNMKVCEKKIGIKEEVTSFVLPLGATINMDGTALYQGIAAVFIAQVYGMDLSFSEQLTIVITTTLASIGTAAVPGVGMIMLVIVLQSINVPAEGIALIFGVDRILDMMRTTANITGDAMVASVIASQEDLLMTEEELSLQAD